MSDDILGKVDGAALALLELAQSGGTNEEKIPFPERIVAFREIAKWAEFRAKTAPKAPVAEPMIAKLRDKFHGTGSASAPKRRRTAVAPALGPEVNGADGDSDDPVATDDGDRPASTH